MTAPDDVAAAARRFFAETWDADLTLGEWWHRFAESGWAFPTFPVGAYGRGLDDEAAAIVDSERRRAGAHRPPKGVSTDLVAPLLLALGTDDQRRRFLPGIVHGTDIWCQLFSEPAAGSDLAGLRTTAARDGDEWIVNGQKVWTSGAVDARWGLLLARTDPTVPKHRGITCFAIDMRQPGVDVRPLQQMDGRAEFNEVFLTDAIAADVDRIGAVGAGWQAAMTVLSVERAGLGAGRDKGASILWAPDLGAPVGEVLAAERATTAEPSVLSPEAVDTLLRAVLAAAPRRRSARDRHDAVHVRSLMTIAWVSEQRAQASGAVGATGSLQKLFGGRAMRATASLLQRLLGARSLVVDDEDELATAARRLALRVPSSSIAGGTDEIQRNIVGERLLGLPAEPRVDKGIAFSDVRT